MGKLGKKARKFAKKNLQSVLRRKRKTKAFFKKRSSTKDGMDDVEDPSVDAVEISNRRNTDGKDFLEISLDAVFSGDDGDRVEDDSDSDGFLSEDSSSPNIAALENESSLEENNVGSTLSIQNQKIYKELVMQKKKLDKLKKKDPKFVKFLESHNEGTKRFEDEEMSDDDEGIKPGMQLGDEGNSAINIGKALTCSVINSWCQIVKEEQNQSALRSLLNAYRAACHYGTESSTLQNSESFCNVLMFVLGEADNIFRSLLGLPSPSCKKEAILELRNTSKWKNSKPLIKSYLRSTLFLLNQVTDSDLLTFSLSRLRVSIIFFAAFPPLLHKLMKIILHLWSTGGGPLSSSSFSIMRDAVILFGSNCFDTCFIKAYKAYIFHSKVSEIVNFKHMQFLRDSLVELCSTDVHKSSSKALKSIQLIAKIFQHGLQSKKKGTGKRQTLVACVETLTEVLKRVCSWEYINCIDLWVCFISANIRDYDELQNLLYIMIQLINGVAYLFPGPRYFPLRLKCIEWLNKLSNSSGIFIPLASFVLDVLEYKTGKEGGKQGETINLQSFLKLPKHWLKSQNFQAECVLSAIELLSAHFAQWSYHITFPDLATIPLIRLRSFHKTTAVESLRGVVKRLIDQVEKNVEFIQKKRDDVPFSPKDHQDVESFLQFEKDNLNAPFSQYYRSVIEKAFLRNQLMNGKTSVTGHKKSKRKRVNSSNHLSAAAGEKDDLHLNRKKRTLKA